MKENIKLRNIKWREISKVFLGWQPHQVGHKVNVSETGSISIITVLKRWFTLTTWHSCQIKI